MKLNNKGLIGTIIYHLLLVLLLVFAGLTFPDPPPEEEGILVNFGTDDSGFGDYEPVGDDQQAGEPDEEIAQEQEETVEEVEPSYTPPPPVETVVADQTQDVEEVKVKEDPKPTAEEIERTKKEKADAAERLKQQRIEEEKRKEEERIERENKEKADRLNQAASGAFGNKGVGETEGSEGETEGDGNQGNPEGSPDSDNYGTGSGLGITFGGLGNREGDTPHPDLSGCVVTQKIEVKVEIVVDRNGKVVSALVIYSTWDDKCLKEMVEKAAMKSKFTPDQAADYKQSGWIKYIIVP